MKKKGICEEFSMINFMSLQSKFTKGELKEHKELQEFIKEEIDYRLSLSKRKDVEEKDRFL